MLHEYGLLGEVLECVQQGREDLLDSALVGEDLLYLLVRDLAFLGRALHVDLQVLLADLLVLRCFVCLLGVLLNDVGSEVRLHHLDAIDGVATGVASLLMLSCRRRLPGRQRRCTQLSPFSVVLYFMFSRRR